MTSPGGVGAGIGLTTIPRAVLSVAAGVMNSVERAMVGPARVRTSQRNAWEAICADRDRARQRDEIHRVVAALAAAAPAGGTAGTAALRATVTTRPGGTGQRTVGSSPRSSAAQVSRVSPGAAGSARPVVLAPPRS